MVYKKRRFGLALCSHVANGQLSQRQYGRRLFAEERIKGYIAALQLNLIETLVLFGPQAETAVYRRHLESAGVASDRVEEYNTSATTFGNAAVMREFMTKRALTESDVIAMTNAYHLIRAQAFAWEEHALHVLWIPTEAFLLALTPKGSWKRFWLRNRLFWSLAFGYLGRIILELNGLADWLLKDYEPGTG